MAAKKRSGFMFMFVILLLLGVIIYTYRDKFNVLFNTGFTNSKEYIDKKFTKKNNKDDKTVTEKINLLDRLKKGRELKEKIDNVKEDVQLVKEKVQDNNKNEIEKKDEIAIKNKKAEEDKPLITKSEEKVGKKEIKVVETKEKFVNESIKKDQVNHETQKLHSRISKLYFTKLLDNEKMSLIIVNRKVIYDDTPLTETLKLLLNGPSKDEVTSSVITNIPNNTKLLSVYIKDKTAFINLSKEFEYNSYGRESTMVQIKQIVYTATEFDSVKYVQFLINGEIKKYLGGEGVIINRPYSRNDFS